MNEHVVRIREWVGVWNLVELGGKENGQIILYEEF